MCLADSWNRAPDGRRPAPTKVPSPYPSCVSLEVVDDRTTCEQPGSFRDWTRQTRPAAVGLGPEQAEGGRRVFAERYAARAVALLEQARGAGHFRRPHNREKPRNDPELQSLHGRADFQSSLGAVGR